MLFLASGARLEPAEFTFNNGTEVSTLDPATVTGVPEGRVLRAIFEGLVIKHPRTLAPEPGVAESWEVSEDGLTYTFHLRSDALWSDGHPVTSEDFLYSFERFLNPRTAAYYAYQLWYVRGARAYTEQVDEDGAPRNDFSSVGIHTEGPETLVIDPNLPIGLETANTQVVWRFAEGDVPSIKAITGALDRLAKKLGHGLTRAQHAILTAHLDRGRIMAKAKSWRMSGK